MREKFLRSIRQMPYWRIIFQVIIWCIVFLLPLLSYNIRVLDPAFYVKECINNTFLVGLFYFHMNFLIPRFFVKGRITTYILLALLGLLTIITEQHTVELYTFRRIPESGFRPVIMPPHRLQSKEEARRFAERYSRMQRREGMPPGRFNHPPPPGEREGPRFVIAGLPGFIFSMTLRKALFSALLILLASGFIKIALEWFKAEKRREELEKEKLNAELGFLKSQVNPHFLFNSLNSIYALARRKADETQEAILQLSQMMRYMIYESNTNTVALEKELDYLQNYIDLKKLRLPATVNINYTIEGSPSGHAIEPMLLIPFVENAFKHGISYSQNCYVEIKITVMQQKLILAVSNKIFHQHHAEVGGIGLENVKKRLALLYPQPMHSLYITEENNIYSVSLTIQLKEGLYD
ncbi:sensor histidine kinase [Filimonas effusa]|nr:histidine kinase [Filimonas effusa]